MSDDMKKNTETDIQELADHFVKKTEEFLAKKKKK